MSQRRACGLIRMDVSSYRYRSRRADDGPLRERLRALAGLRRRFGYWRLGWLLEREGAKANLEKVYLLYREEGLAVKRRRGRRRDECLNELRWPMRGGSSKPAHRLQHGRAARCRLGRLPPAAFGATRRPKEQRGERAAERTARNFSASVSADSPASGAKPLTKTSGMTLALPLTAFVMTAPPYE